MKLPFIPRQAEGGFLLILTLVEGFVFLTTLMGIGNLALYELGAAQRETYNLDATYAAEAGGDNAMYQINTSSSYTGTNTTCPIGTSGENPVTLYSNAEGKATYENCVTAGTIANEKIVYSVGKVYVPATASSPVATKTVKLVAEGTQNTADPVATGPGGLNMSTGASISQGPVYVNGALNLSVGSTIGKAGSPVNVYVANERCPSPVTTSYPAICPSGTLNNPISLTVGSSIVGNVQANGQTNTANMSGPGLTASSGVAASSLPTFDRTAEKAKITAAANTSTAANATCSLLNNKTWSANLHITGSVNMSLCTTTISGDVWLDGNLSLTTSAQIKVANGLTTMPVIMVDGSSGFTLSTASSIVPNSAGVGVEIITFYSKAACSPDCSSVTGSDLVNSMAVNTINLNVASGSNSSIFYAYWTGATIDVIGTVGALWAQEVNLNVSGNITFGSLVGDTSGTYTWDVRYYELQ